MNFESPSAEASTLNPMIENTGLRELLAASYDESLRVRDELLNQRDANLQLQDENRQLRAQLNEQALEQKQLETEVRTMRATKVWQIGSLYWRAHARVSAVVKR